MVDVLQIATFAVILLIAVAWYLSYSAARLDRLHAKVEGAMSALDAQLIRRAEAALELANSGVLDPASALLIADAATESLERTTEQPVTDDLLDGQHFGGREGVESDLTAALSAALPDAVVQDLRARHDDLVADELDRVAASVLRVQLARRFHNDAVRDVRRVRAKRTVRWFGLAGYAALPEPVVFDDAAPPGLGR
ncbi:membrane protein [Fodinibacter luteus]|uniref:Membrane protein n=1 Tax=Fodinibacter luteus TaxID=552064 RepID=A0ABP8KM76_9MICO